LLQHGGCGQRGRQLLLPFDGLVQDRNLSAEFGEFFFSLAAGINPVNRFLVYSLYDARK
jgi:hypothetical protein